MSDTPPDALIVFTNGSGSSQKSIITWQDPVTSNWESDIEIVEFGSPQIIELTAVVTAFSKFACPFKY